MFVPNCANAKAKEMMKTPNLAGPFAVWPVFGLRRKYDSKLSGFHMASPQITAEDEETMMPTNDVTAKPTGMVMSWDQRASLGFLAKRAKSGSLTIRVAKFAIDDMMPWTMAQPNAPPDFVAPLCTMGPIPCARTIAQMKKAIPAGGTKKDFAVNRWRILCTGNQMNGKLQSQKRKKLTKPMVSVPALAGKPLGTSL